MAPPSLKSGNAFWTVKVGAAEVGIENVIEDFLARLCYGAQFGDARIRVEDVNPSVPLVHQLEQGVELGGFRDIRSNRETIRAKLFLSRGGGLRVTPGHNDLGTLLDELLCRSKADPTGTAGNDDKLVREAIHGLLLRPPGIFDFEDRRSIPSAPTAAFLALQLPICFEVRALSGSLVSSAPE
jgi:hypothetical protein